MEGPVTKEMAKIAVLAANMNFCSNPFQFPGHGITAK